jgi:hypothetical protein
MRSPNLLVFLPDQQRTDTMACYGGTKVHAPALNKLASESVIFELCDPAYLHAFARVFAQRFVATYYWLHQKQRSTGAALSYLCRTSRE